jgi:uncharacterized protein (TIGR02266 family)
MGLDRKASDRGGKMKSGPESRAIARRILLVGDKPVFAALRQGLLRSGESKVMAAASGGEGLRVALTAPPDVILLDAELPDMDGFEVCRRLRVDPITEAIPVIVLTGNSQPQWSQNPAETSAVASVPMGIDTARLLNMIQMVLTTPLTRRAASRASVQLGVDYIHADTTGTGKTLNLSQDGMFIVTASPPEVGTHLIIHFALPEGEPLEGTAQVVWIRQPEAEHPYPPGMAVQFLKLPPEARPAIAAFVAEQLGKSVSSKLR